MRFQSVSISCTPLIQRSEFHSLLLATVSNARRSDRGECALAGPQDQHQAAVLQNYLADYYGEHHSLDWNCHLIKARRSSLDDLNPHDIDCLILFGHPAAMNGKVLEQIHDYWQCGGSLAAVRIADFALNGGADFASDIFGGEYRYDHLLQPAKISFMRDAGNHQLLRGVGPFLSRGGLHRYDVFPGEDTPILFGASSGEKTPVAWVRSKYGRRVFATTLGSPSDFQHPCFLRLLANAIVWTAR